MKKRISVLDVFVNGKKWCRAGVGDDGVLSAIVTWARLSGPAALGARKAKKSAYETRLHVGGLAGETHRRWRGGMLKTGDRVLIKLAEAETFDPPVGEKPADTKFAEKQERRYYLKLKRKFEGAKSRRAKL